MNRLTRLVDVFTMLKPYTKSLVAENAAKGTPVQRALFLYNEDDERCYTEQHEYLFGPDMLVAPVFLAEQTGWEVYIPKGEWIHLWTGAEYGKGIHKVAAELGNIPVFYKKGVGVSVPGPVKRSTGVSWHAYRIWSDPVPVGDILRKYM